MAFQKMAGIYSPDMETNGYAVRYVIIRRHSLVWLFYEYSKTPLKMGRVVEGKNILPFLTGKIFFNFVFVPLYHCGTMVRSCLKTYQDI